MWRVTVRQKTKGKSAFPEPRLSCLSTNSKTKETGREGSCRRPCKCVQHHGMWPIKYGTIGLVRSYRSVEYSTSRNHIKAIESEGYERRKGGKGSRTVTRENTSVRDKGKIIVVNQYSTSLIKAKWELRMRNEAQERETKGKTRPRTLVEA